MIQVSRYVVEHDNGTYVVSFFNMNRYAATRVYHSLSLMWAECDAILAVGTI